MAPPRSYEAYISPVIWRPVDSRFASHHRRHMWNHSPVPTSNQCPWNRSTSQIPRRRCSLTPLASVSTESMSDHDGTEENERRIVSTSPHVADPTPGIYPTTSESMMDDSHPDSLTALQIRDRRRVTRLLELVLPDEESTSRNTSSIARAQNIMWTDEEEAEYLQRQEYRLDHSHYNALRVDAAVKQHRTEIDALVLALEQSFDRQVHSSKIEILGLWPGTYALLYARKVTPKRGAKSKWLRGSPYLRELAGTLVGLNTLRSTVARLVFKTTDRFQLLIGNRYVINMFRFRLLGTFTGCVTTRGRIQHMHSSGDGVDGEPDVHDRDVKFESPRITLGRALNIRYGKESSALMRTTYLDDRIRVVYDARDVLYVFARLGPESDGFKLANQWKAHLAAKPIRRRVALLGSFLFGLGCSLVAWTFGDRSLATLTAAIIGIAVTVATLVLKRES